MQADQLWQRSSCGADISQEAVPGFAQAMERQVAQALQRRKVEVDEAGAVVGAAPSRLMAFPRCQHQVRETGRQAPRPFRQRGLQVASARVCHCWTNTSLSSSICMLAVLTAAHVNMYVHPQTMSLFVRPLE